MQTPLKRRSSLLLIPILALIFITGCTGGCNKGTNSDGPSEKDSTAAKATEESAEQSAIQPPIPEADPPYTEYSIDPKKDTTIHYPTGSKIHIPSKAFLTQDGKVVKEEVKLRYREMHDPIDFFAAGVPMSIQQNGEKKVFESAGMCDIRASMKVESGKGDKSNKKDRTKKSDRSKRTGQAKEDKKDSEGGKNANGQPLASMQNGKDGAKGEELKVNPERKIQVEMASEVKGDFPVYHMDEEKGEWEQTSNGAGKTKALSSEGPLVSAEGDIGHDVDISEPSPAPPNRIKLFKLQRIDMQEVDIDESNYKGGKQRIRTEDAGSSSLTEHYLTFVHDAQPVQGSKRMDRRSSNTIERMKGHLLMATSQEDCEFPRYATQVHAKKVPGTSSLYKVTVNAKEDAKAKKTCICKRVPSIKTLKKDLKKEWEKYRKAVAKYDSLKSSSKKNSEMAQQVEAKVRRLFQVEEFGPVNCDDPKRFPDDAKLLANFKTADGKALVLPRFKLATMDPKMIVDYHQNEKVKFDPEMRNLLWGVTDKGALAYCPPERFKKVDPSEKGHTFTMTVEQKVDSYEELRELLMPESSS